MSGRIVVTPVELNDTRVLLIGLIKDGRLIEARLDALPEDDEGCGSDPAVPDRLLGNIYVGKVRRIVPNLNAAFVDIAPGTPCYLSLENTDNAVFVRRSRPDRIVREDELLVQVQRDASRGKAPALSTNLNFTGRYAVLTTGNRRIGISSKLDNTAREHYKNLLKGTCPKGCGLIVRTNAAQASDEDLLGEIGSLSLKASRVVSRADTHTCYSCLFRPEPPYLSYLQGIYTEEIGEIVTDLPAVYESLSAYCSRYSDLSAIPLRLYEDPSFPLVSLYNLNRELMRASSRDVRLKSGGFIIIDPTEAMTVIDVNTGKGSAGRVSEDFFLRINREASREIALQLRLRNISGIIIVDYIDLDTDLQKKELLGELRRLVGTDPIPVTVHDITALNLVEITRKKVEKSLSEQIKRLTTKNPL